MASYLRPDVLVETEFVERHHADGSVRIVECDEDRSLYPRGHIAGAQNLDYEADLCVPNSRDCISPAEFERLASRLGIGHDTTVIFYGDQNNMLACFSYWVFRLHGHQHLKLMNGGRQKWIAEHRQLTVEVPTYKATPYKVRQPHPEFRALREQVLEHIGKPDPRSPRAAVAPDRAVVDDRTPAEFRGEFLPRPEIPPRFLRGGHIPGAVNVPWNELMNRDGTFRSADEIGRALAKRGVTQDKDVVVYTRIGERSSLMWFALHELMGFPKVRNYDGSWMEWGNTVGIPIESATMPAHLRETAPRSSREREPQI